MNIRIPVLSVVLAVAVSHADSLKTYAPLRHSFQLQINDLIDIASFSNTIICYKYRLNRKESIRCGINFSGNMANTLDKETRSGTLSTDTRSTENSRQTADFEAFCSYIRYPYARSNLFLYYGLGPLFSVAYQYSENTYAADTVALSLSRNESTAFEAGLRGQLGIEWFFSRHFSLLTEYNLSAYYTGQIMRAEGSSSSDNLKRTMNGCTLRSNGVVLGLSVYL